MFSFTKKRRPSRISDQITPIEIEEIGDLNINPSVIPKTPKYTIEIKMLSDDLPMAAKPSLVNHIAVETFAPSEREKAIAILTEMFTIAIKSAKDFIAANLPANSFRRAG
jgi:hypothetical protein